MKPIEGASYEIVVTTVANTIRSSPYIFSFEIDSGWICIDMVVTH